MAIGMFPAAALADTYGELIYTIERNKVIITDCNETAAGVIEIPSEINGYPVTTIGEYAFYGCGEITEIKIPNSITKIEMHAFGSCTSLTNINIPDSINEIGFYVFANCKKLSNIIIPQSVTTISDSAFRYCTGLEEITIPSSVTTIQNSAFYGCTNLSSIDLPDSLTLIAGNAFCETALYNNENNWENNALYINDVLLEVKDSVWGEFTVKSQTKFIANCAFKDCIHITKIVLPVSVTLIGQQAFYNRQSLTDINIPDNVTHIDDSAFSGCSDLTDIVIPGCVESINNYAFYECSSLTNVTIENGVCSIGDNAFDGCWKLTGITIPGSVISIGNNAFSRCWNAEELNIESGVQYIGEYAFQRCYKLKSISFPDSISSIGYCAFSDCSGLESIVVPGAAAIGYGAFMDCENLSDIKISKNVISIDNKAFNNTAYYNDSSNRENGVLYIENALITAENTVAGEYTIKEGTTILADSAFYGCTEITGINIPDSVVYIGGSAFSGCSGITNIIIPNSVKSINNHIFANCSALTDVVLPDKVTSIGYGSFSGCQKLASINIPDGITFIGENAFSNTALSNNVNNWENNAFYIDSFLIKVSSSASGDFTVKNGTALIANYAFYYCSDITSVTIPDGLKYINSFAFYGCSGLTEVCIPEGVTSIERSTFGTCSNIVRISLPKSISHIYSYAFNRCTSITDVYYQGTEKEFVKINIDEGNELLTTSTIHYKETANTSPDPDTGGESNDPVPSVPESGDKDTDNAPSSPGSDGKNDGVTPAPDAQNKVETADSSEVFKDVKDGSWYEEYVSYVYSYGLMNGTNAGDTFEPNTSMSRAMLVTILSRIAGADTDSLKNNATQFKDVETGKWYSGAVVWALENGLTTGTSAASFSPNDDITRQDLCVFLVRYASKAGIKLKADIAKTAFPDDDKLGSWAREAVYVCQQAGIVNGTSDGSFDPKGNATRSAVAKMITVFHSDYIA